MSAVGNPNRGTGGQILGLGLNGIGQVLDLFGPGDPNAIADSGDVTPGCVSAAVGSTFRRLDAPDVTHCLYIKTALPNTWSHVTAA